MAEQNNPIFTDTRLKRKLLMEVESLLVHCIRYVVEAGSEAEKSFSSIFDSREKYLKKGGPTQESIINGAIQSFQKFRPIIMSPPYKDTWLYKFKFTLTVEKSCTIDYRMLNDRLSGKLEKDDLSFFEKGFHKFVISIFRMISENHSDTECELLCESVIDEINITLGIATKASGGDFFSGMTDLMNNDQIAGFVGKMAENENVMKYVQKAQEGGLESLPEVLGSAIKDKDLLDQAKEFVPPEVKKNYGSMMENFNKGKDEKK